MIKHIIKNDKNYQTNNLNFCDNNKYQKCLKEINEKIAKEKSFKSSQNQMIDLNEFGIKNISFIVKKIDYFFDLSTIEIQLNNSSNNVNIENLPSGIKRMLLFYFKYCIKEKNDSKDSEKETKRIFIIDELEKFLHPEYINIISNILKKIAETNYVFISTHSPFI